MNRLYKRLGLLKKQNTLISCRIAVKGVLLRKQGSVRRNKNTKSNKYKPRRKE